jgi:hypothetical protein
MNLTAFLLALRILVIGDSQAHALGREFVTEARMHGAEVWSKAECGSSTIPWASRKLVRLLEKYEPDILLVSLGTNDAGGIIARKVFPRKATWIVDKAHEYGAEVVWVIPPQNKMRVQNLMNWVRNHSTADRVFDSTCLDLKIHDGVHPTRKASKYWARIMWMFLMGQEDPCHPFPMHKWEFSHSSITFTLRF